MACIIVNSARKWFCWRGYFTLILCAVFVLNGRITNASAGADLVFDAQTGDVLYSSNAGNKWYPASLTKMMTAYLVFRALDKGQVNLKTMLTVSRNASRQPPSKLGLKPGTKISVDKALEALIVRSANDIAVVLAEGVANSEAGFVKTMNKTAKSLGMDATRFANPHGLENKKQITTARDMGILARRIIQEFPQRKHYFKMQQISVGKRTLSTRNRLLKSMPGADGMKTGFICASGFNIVASATRGDRRLVAIVMGSLSAKVRNARVEQLLDWAFSYKPDGDDIFGKTTLAKMSNGVLWNRPTDMRAEVCKKRPAKKRRGKKRRRHKKKHRAKKS